MNIKLTTRIRYQGQEYSNPNDLPPDARAAYERALAGQGNVIPSGGKMTQFVVNGQPFSSPAEMPEAERKLYEDAMELMQQQASATAPTAPPSEAAPASQTAPPSQPAADTGWLSKRQLQLIAVVAALLIAAALIVASRL
jgi:hypothetical protein